MFFHQMDITNEAFRLLSQEYAIAKHKFESLKRSNLENSIENGDILGPLKFIQTEKKRTFLLTFRCYGYFTRFRTGDFVDVYTFIKNQLVLIRENLFVNDVKFPEEGQIELNVSVREAFQSLNSYLNENTEYYFFPSDESVFLSSIQNRLKTLHDRPVRGSFFKPEIITKETKIISGLNNSQKEVLQTLIDQGLQGLVQGPPGTGKTHLLRAVVELALQNNLTIGVSGFTHASVDNALSLIIRGLQQKDKDKYIRVGVKNKIKWHLYGDSHLNSVSSFSQLKKFYQIYASTMHSFCLAKRNVPELDLLIIDEAGQVPVYFYPFLSRLAQRVLMLGDDKQLPPVMQAPDQHRLPNDIFSLARQNLKEKPPMLEIQYRMNKYIQSWSSDRFYEKKLKPDPSVCDRDILRQHPYFGSSPIQLDLHNHLSQDHVNKYEANRVAQLVDDLISKAGVPLKEIGIITPYRMQGGAVNSAIQRQLGVHVMQDLNVDTVERFQGQEREVMILSFGAERDVAHESDQPFLGDGRRLNVSITRAKSRFYCFASQHLYTQGNPYSKEYPSYLKDFLNYCHALSKTKHSKKSSMI